MSRYFMAGSRGVPKAGKPVPAADVTGIGDYMTKDYAFQRLTPPPERIAKLKRVGYTHLAMYDGESKDALTEAALITSKPL